MTDENRTLGLNIVCLAVRAEPVEAHSPFDRLRANELKRTALRWVWVLIVVLECFTQYAQADERFWLHSGGLTYHFDRDADRNGNNLGIGVEYRFTAEHWIGGGIFRNSYGDVSPYLGYAYVPWRWKNFLLGGSIGLTSNYESDDRGPALFMLPVIAYDWKHVGVNVLLVPFENGLIGAQLKFRF